MTHALTVVLKPGYAPIEQYGDVASMTQGAWTDIYALACVVYYAITGKTPMSSVERLMDDRLEPIASRRRAATATASCARSMPRSRCGRRTGRRTRRSSAPCSTSTCRAPPPAPPLSGYGALSHEPFPRTEDGGYSTVPGT
jgi:serine/threonine protein kinase